MFDTKKAVRKIIGSTKRGGKNDWDGDGVINKKDCQPRNTMRQDLVSDVKSDLVDLRLGRYPRASYSQPSSIIGITAAKVDKISMNMYGIKYNELNDVQKKKVFNASKV